jgi:hypothetical protein
MRVPLAWVGGMPAAKAVVSDGVKARPGLFALGTARAATLIGRGSLSRPAKGDDQIRIRAVEFDGALFEQTPAEIGPAPDSELAGALGTAVLARGRLILDGRR